ncbi:MAG TPA: Ig-like domain-containing protein, partial [Pirellulaceae bacterium]|nr:Ig-like domain-containing protein [Pirellulaceae bacterium]
GTVSLIGGNITYTPPTNYNNNIGGPDTFTYTVTDNGTTAGAADPKSATGTVTINVAAVNDPPVPVNDNKAAVEDTPLTFPATDLTANDGKGGGSDESSQTLTVTAVSAASQRGGTVSLASGTVTYTPATDFNGQDTFTYTVSDGQGQNSTATCTVSVAVSEVNDPPTAGNDTATAVKNQATTYNASILLANDSPGPANESGQTLTITGVSNAVNGSVQLVGGNPVFTPNANFEGTGSFQYTVSDNGTTNGAADPKTATATVNLNVVNYIPSTVSGFVYVDLDNDGVKDGTEPALAGIDVTLSGTDFQGGTISGRTAITDRSGYYEFTNLSPGNYLVTQSQAANMVDGRESASGPLTVNANDQFRFNQSLTDNINAATHSYANNNFGERSVTSSFLSLYQLLASSADNPATTGVNEAEDRLMFSFNDSGTNLDWYVFGAGWDNLKMNSITMAGDLRSATLRVTDAQNRVWQTTVSIDSARLRYRQDSSGRVMGSIEGSYADQSGWTQVTANGGGGEGEGEAYDQEAVSAEQYARAADAAFA